MVKDQSNTEDSRPATPIDELNRKLVNLPPTDTQIDYFAFCSRYMGWEFIEIETGKIRTKLFVWLKSKESITTLNLWIDGSKQVYKPIPKTGWKYTDNGTLYLPKKTRIREPKYNE
jgi:hypothetical protein